MSDKTTTQEEVLRKWEKMWKKGEQAEAIKGS